MNPSAIILLSGGVDSATALYWALNKGYRVTAVTFNYCGRPVQELIATRKIAKRVKVDCFEVALPFLRSADSLKRKNLTFWKRSKVPEGFIPSRNLIFYALGSYFTEIFNAQYIIGGHVKTDAEGFPDATPKFFSAIQQIINESKLDGDPLIKILLPFFQKTKTAVAKMAKRLKVPVQVTWSCYYDGQKPCGTCEACQEREEALRKASAVPFKRRN